jgi:membrane protein DedA with SNARE-associated domain
MNLRQFIELNGLGAMVYAPLWIWLSMFAGKKFSRSQEAVTHAKEWVGNGHMIILVIVLLIVAAMIWGFGRKKNKSGN